MDALLLKVDLAAGAVPWSKLHDTGGGADDYGHDLAVSADGSTIYSMESHYLYPTTTRDILSYATAGGTYNWTSSGPSVAMSSILVGTDGFLYTRGETVYSYGLARYSPATGAQSWSTTYPATMGDSSAFVISPDALHAFVTGNADGDATTVSLATT